KALSHVVLDATLVHRRTWSWSIVFLGSRREASWIERATGRIPNIVQTVKWCVNEYSALARPILVQWAFFKLDQVRGEFRQHVVIIELLPIYGAANTY